MPASDLQSWDPLFKEDYHPKAIINSLQDENLIQDFMAQEMSDETWQGRVKVVPQRIGRNFSTGAIPSKGTLPAQGRTAYADSRIPMRNLYTRVGFDKETMLASRNRKGAFASVMEQEMDAALEDMAFTRNRIAWGTGKGTLALVSTGSAGSVLEVKNPGGVPGVVNANRYLFGDTTTGQTIVVLDGTTPTTIRGAATITAINADGTDVTLSAPIAGVANNDIVVIGQGNTLAPTQNSYNMEPEGMLAMVDDGTYVDLYHGLSRTTYPIIKSWVVTGVGALSLDAIQQAIDGVSIRVGGTVDLLIAEHGVRRAYLALLEADRRYTGADLMRPDGGTASAKNPSGKKAVTYGDIPLLVERDCPYGMLFGVKKDTFIRYYEDNGGWADEEGSVLKWMNEYDAYTAFFRLFENYHNYKPAKNFRMEGITTNQFLAHAF